MLLWSSIFLVALVLPRGARAQGQCFLPDGSKDDNDVPCFANDSTSRCCAPDEFCNSNQLCVLKDNQQIFARGSCLDQQFGPTCPNFCKGIKDSGKVDLYACRDTSAGTFCCDEGNGNSCCSTLSKVFTLGIGTIFVAGATDSIIMSTMSSALAAQQSPDVDDGREDKLLGHKKTTTSIITSILTSVEVSTQTPQTVTSALVITSVQIQTSIVRSIQTSIITSIQTASVPAPLSMTVHMSMLSTAQLPSVRTTTLSPVFSLSSTLLTSTQHMPTNIDSSGGGFTGLPSPVFTSIVVPTPTPPPLRSTKSTTSIQSSASSDAPATPSTSTSATSPAESISATAIADSSTISETGIPTASIIAIVVSTILALTLLLAFVLLLRKQRQQTIQDKKNEEEYIGGGKYMTDLKRNSSIRSGKSIGAYSQKSAFGYAPKHQNSAESATGRPMNISVPIVYRGDNPGALSNYSTREVPGSRSGTDASRLSGTTYLPPSGASNQTASSSQAVPALPQAIQALPQLNMSISRVVNSRDITPSSEYDIYASPTSLKSRTSFSSGTYGRRSKGSDTDSGEYLMRLGDDDDIGVARYTPEDLNRVGGTGYGQSGGVAPTEIDDGKERVEVDGMEGSPSESGWSKLDGMEQVLPTQLAHQRNASDGSSRLSMRSTTFRKLLYDVQSQPF